MPRSYSRTQRIGDLIQTALAEIIHAHSAELGCGMTTMTGVEVSPDLSVAKVYVSVLEDERAVEIVAGLNKVTKYLRYELAHAVKLRVTPELRFFYDDSVVRGSRLSSLIDGALKNK